MGEGTPPSASGHQSIAKLEREKKWVGWDPEASLPTLKVSSFPACRHHSVNTFCVCLAQSHTRGSRNHWRRNQGKELHGLSLLRQGDIQTVLKLMSTSPQRTPYPLFSTPPFHPLRAEPSSLYETEEAELLCFLAACGFGTAVWEGKEQWDSG